MTEKPAAVSARIGALEQLLLVAVLRGDEHARTLACSEIARLKRQLASAAKPERTGLSIRTATASAPAPAH